MAGMAWLDKMIGRVRDADDVAAARTAVADYIDPSTGERKVQPGEDGDTHVHIHMPGKEGGMANGQDQDDPNAVGAGGGNDDPTDVTQLAARLAALEAIVKKLQANEEEEVELEGEGEDGVRDARRFMLRRGGKMGVKKTADELDVPEHKPDIIGETDLPGIEDLDKRMAAGDRRKARDARWADSADMEELWDEMAAATEIIAPGMKVRTFDSRLPARRTAERMCSHRRAVFDHAMKNEDTREAVQDAVGIKEPGDFRVMSCDSVKMAFNATAALIKARSNDGIGRTSVEEAAAAARGGKTADGKDKPAGAPSLSQMNKNANEFWAARKNNGSTRA